MPTIDIASSRIPARYVAILCNLLESTGVDADAVLRAAGLDRGLLDQADHVVCQRQLEQVLADASRVSGRTDLAFEMGRCIKLNSHDILSGALLGCATLDQLLRLFARYYRLVNPMFALSYLRDGDHAELLIRPLMPMSPLALRFWLETTAVSMYLQIKSAIQTTPVSAEMVLPIETPPHLARYAALAPARIHFVRAPQSEIRIHIREAHLDAPLPMANAQAVSLAEERCKALLTNYGIKKSYSEWISMILHEAQDCQPVQAELAKRLNIATRTLDRYLRKEGTSFRELSLRIRNQRARSLLNDGRLTVSQIAYTLGYSDIANFSRSFKKMVGLCPSAYQDRSRPQSE